MEISDLNKEQLLRVATEAVESKHAKTAYKTLKRKYKISKADQISLAKKACRFIAMDAFRELQKLTLTPKDHLELSWSAHRNISLESALHWLNSKPNSKALYEAINGNVQEKLIFVELLKRPNVQKYILFNLSTRRSTLAFQALKKMESDYKISYKEWAQLSRSSNTRVSNYAELRCVLHVKATKSYLEGRIASKYRHVAKIAYNRYLKMICTDGRLLVNLANYAPKPEHRLKALRLLIKLPNPGFDNIYELAHNQVTQIALLAFKRLQNHRTLNATALRRLQTNAQNSEIRQIAGIELTKQFPAEALVDSLTWRN